MELEEAGGGGVGFENVEVGGEELDMGVHGASWLWKVKTLIADVLGNF